MADNKIMLDTVDAISRLRYNLSTVPPHTGDYPDAIYLQNYRVAVTALDLKLILDLVELAPIKVDP